MIADNRRNITTPPSDRSDGATPPENAWRDRAAKMYVIEQVVSDMADRITAAVADHQGVVDLDAERRWRR